MTLSAPGPRQSPPEQENAIMSSNVAGILDFEDLQQVTGYVRRADVERVLREQGIKIFHGRKGPWTTTELINHAAGLAAGNQEHYGPDILR
jgi:hypothetical protein